MGTALVGVDVVGEAEDGFLVGGVPLHRDLDLAILVLALEVDGLAMKRVLVLVEVGDEVDQPALVMERVPLTGATLVDELDLQALGEERGLAQPLGEGRIVELELVEDLAVGLEGDRRAGRLRRLALLQRALRAAALVVLGPDMAVAADLEVEGLREGVDDRDADAMEAARDFVAAAIAELASGVEGGEDDLGGGAFLFFQVFDRDPASVVADGAAVVGVKDDADFAAVAGEGLVDGIVDDLVDEVMQAAWTGRSDVHPGPLANRLQPLEDGDVLGPVGASRGAPSWI